MPENPPPPQPASSALHYSNDTVAAKRGNGSGWILALSLLQLIGGLIMYGMTASKLPADDPGAIGVLVTTVGLAAVFFGLWLWGRRHPFPALLTALIVFVTFHLLDAVLDPLSLLRGIIMKVVIIVGLCTALKKAYVAKREKELAAPPVL
jgi:4-amino-4-deoxy-L-arabinose transferase-like glycosyltransferase